MQFLVALILMSGVVTVLGEDCKPGTCRPGQTCCPTNIPTIFGCCDYEDAVCCSDRTHCCPKDTMCDLEKAACFPTMEEFGKQESFYKLEKRQGPLDEDRRAERRVWCDTTTYCPSGSTCCTQDDGSYDCCPSPFASCCPDKLHCCHHGSVCDATSRYCLQEDNELATYSGLKVPAMEIELSDLE